MRRSSQLDVRTLQSGWVLAAQHSRVPDIAQGALESAGIAAAIEAVPVGNKNSPLLFGEPVFRVVVREEDAEAAHGVLDTSRE